MAKSRQKQKPTPEVPHKIQNEIDQEKEIMVKNGLSQAILGQGFGIPGIGVQLSQSDTLFKNMRWYLISNMRQLLSEAYVEMGLIQTVVDVPVDDALRGGVEIKTKELSEDEIDLLLSDMDREDDLGVVAQAAKWNRLFGGAGIVIVTGQEPTQPLNVEALNMDSPLQFRAVDMWELFWTHQNTTDYAASIDMSQMSPVEFYDYYGVKLHHTRAMKLIGLTAPSFVRPRLRGWGFSVVESLVRSINQYLKANDLSFEVLDEFKVDVYKIKNLANTLLSPNGEAKVRQRIQLANQEKNFQNAITMDSEDEWDHKQLSFAGLSEVMTGLRIQLASELKMPLTKLFGVSATGFSSGEDDIENYNAMVESQVRQKVKYYILNMIGIRCQRRFGFIPSDLSINYKPLRILSSEQEENVKTQKFTRLLQAKQAGEITSKEFKEGCNRDKLLPIQLDPEIDTLDLSGESTEPKEEGKLSEELDEDKGELKELKTEDIDLKDRPVVVNEKELFMNSNDKSEGQVLQNPGHVDEAKWERAKKLVQKEYGEIRWPAVTYIYKKLGGKFS